MSDLRDKEPLLPQTRLNMGLEVLSKDEEEEEEELL